MSIVDKIIMLLDEKKLNQKELTDYLEVDKSTFSQWKNGKSSSYKKYLPEIARFFSISVDELVGNSKQNDELDEAYFSFAKRAQSEGIAPEDIELALKTIQELKYRGKNKDE